MLWFTLLRLFKNVYSKIPFELPFYSTFSYQLAMVI